VTFDLKAENDEHWRKMSILVHYEPMFLHVAKQLIGNKDRYRDVADRTGVPWWVIAVIHEREASQSWKANLAQGDPWDRRSTHVPRGRGPFKSWDDAAYDALVNCAPHTAKNKDWTAGGTLAALEDYNGDGYEVFHHMASPYNWAGTTEYSHGKYTSDGHFDPWAVDHQLGCAGIIKAMMQIDVTIAFAQAA
jgi:lysozyme family protein